MDIPSSTSGRHDYLKKKKKSKRGGLYCLEPKAMKCLWLFFSYDFVSSGSQF